MPYITGPLSSSHSTGRGRLISRSPSPSSSGKHIFLREYENATTQVAVSVKTKGGKDSNKKRSVSSSNFQVSKENVGDSRKKHEPLKQTNVQYGVSPRSRAQTRPTTRSHLTTTTSTGRAHVDSKHLTWDEALRDKNSTCKAVRTRSPQFPAKDYHQVCRNELAGLQSGHHRSVEVSYRRPTSLPKKNETSRFIERISSYVNEGKQSISDLSTARSNSTIKSTAPISYNNCQSDGEDSGVCYISQSVQCKLPSSSTSPLRSRKPSSTEESQRDADLETSTANSTKVFPSFYHPITSLGFQCQELMLHVDKSSVLHKIVRGIEYNLSRLCPNMFDSKWREFPDWPAPEANERSLNKRLAKIKDLTAMCKSVREDNKILQESISGKDEKITDLENKLKKSNQESDELRSQLDEMTKKAEEYSKALSKSAQLISELQEEVKVIPLLRSMQTKHNERMQEVVRENEMGKLDVQKMKLEHEKFKTLISSKDIQLQKYREEIMSIQQQVVEQFNKLQSANRELKLQLGAEIRRKRLEENNGEESVSSVDLPSRRKTRKGKKKIEQGRQIAKFPTCSSPSSEHTDSSLGVYPSWDQISPINPELNRDLGTEDSIDHVFMPLVQTVPTNQTTDTSHGGHISIADEGPYRSNNETLQNNEFYKLIDSNAEQQETQLQNTLSVKHSQSVDRLSDGVSNLFEELKKLTQMSKVFVLPSPPKVFVDLMPPPSELSHWSDSFEDLHLFSDDNNIFFNKKV